jgi:hypothetical protein
LKSLEADCCRIAYNSLLKTVAASFKKMDKGDISRMTKHLTGGNTHVEKEIIVVQLSLSHSCIIYMCLE